MTNPTDTGPMPEYPQIRRQDGILFFAIHEDNREEISISIERLIDLADLMETDPDLEETGDEHDTGAPEGWRGVAHWQASGQDMILEDDEEGDVGEDDGTDEPSLGSPELSHWSSQAQWAKRARHDGEEDAGDAPEFVNEDGGNILDEPHDGGDDDEPPLGWANPMGIKVQDMPAGWSATDTDGHGGLAFIGDGHAAANKSLQERGLQPRRATLWALPLPEPGSLLLRIS